MGQIKCQTNCKRWVSLNDRPIVLQLKFKIMGQIKSLQDLFRHFASEDLVLGPANKKISNKKCLIKICNKNSQYKKEEEKDLVLGPGLLTRLILAAPTHLEEKNIN